MRAKPDVGIRIPRPLDFRKAFSFRNAKDEGCGLPRAFHALAMTVLTLFRSLENSFFQNSLHRAAEGVGPYD